MTPDQQALVDRSKSITTNLFDNFISHLTGGLIPDIQTGMIAVVCLIVLYMTFDLISTLVFGFDLSEELEYREYKNKRSRADRFRSRYADDIEKERNKREISSLPVHGGKQRGQSIDVSSWQGSGHRW